MKTIGVISLLLAAAPLFAQPSPSSGTLWLDSSGTTTEVDLASFAIIWSFSIENGVKTLTLETFDCAPNPVAIIFNLGALAFSISGGQSGICINNGGSPNAEDYSAVQPLIKQLDTWANGLPEEVQTESVPHRPLQSFLATLQPAAPPDPSAIFLDGLSGNILQVDLKTGVTQSTVTPPTAAIGPLAIRPTPTLPSTEVWVANGATQVSVLNMSTQTVTANIPTPSIPSSATPAGIVFTNTGAICIEAFKLSSPDSAGNLGVLVIFDAANRAVSSTFPLKYAPAKIVIAPDSTTAYLLSTGGQITYYDVLSGTADLSASTFTPGMNNGYNGVSNVFIHPDGTRLFWAVGPNVESFDLTARKVTAQFNSGLPTTSAITLGFSQDGALATLSNGQGNAVILDTQYGIIQAAITFSGPSQLLLGN